MSTPYAVWHESLKREVGEWLNKNELDGTRFTEYLTNFIDLSLDRWRIERDAAIAKQNEDRPPQLPYPPAHRKGK